MKESQKLLHSKSNRVFRISNTKVEANKKETKDERKISKQGWKDRKQKKENFSLVIECATISIFNNGSIKLQRQKLKEYPIYLNEMDTETNSASFWSYKQIGSESVFMHIKCLKPLVYVFPTLAPSKTEFQKLKFKKISNG